MTKPDIKYNFKRHDNTRDQSLRPYSAADEYLLQEYNRLVREPTRTAVYHDRFGYLSCNLHSYKPNIILTTMSQEKAIELNLKNNKLPSADFSYPLSGLDDKIEFALIKIPKSLALFEFFLQHITQNSTKDTTVVCAFMTRHFSPKILEIASKYFENVEQSRAVKKARLMTLTKKKDGIKIEPIDTLDFNGQTYRQYWGVFSSNHIDYATQFLIENLELNPTDNTILDLASGNGVIAKEIILQLPHAEIHLMDDFYLAVESAKLNIEGESIHHHYNNDLSNFEDNTFDIIVTNPPFHIEYEVSIDIPLQLFRDSLRCLKDSGNLQVVANKHLNYMTHLKSIFPTVEVLNENDKFIIYKCVKKT
ncbi:methyltransferase [Saprospiraceae bacterium]|nr:methyltransferase [Saprospiraceae bacterium]